MAGVIARHILSVVLRAWSLTSVYAPQLVLTFLHTFAWKPPIATIFPTRRRNFLGNTVASHNWSDRTTISVASSPGPISQFFNVARTRATLEKIGEPGDEATISERAAKFPRISRRCNAKRIPQTTHNIIINSHIRSANALLELRKVYGLPVVLV